MCVHIDIYIKWVICMCMYQYVALAIIFIMLYMILLEHELNTKRPNTK